MTSTVEMIRDAARRRADELEIALMCDPEPWQRDELKVELSKQIQVIEDCMVMLGEKRYLSWHGNRQTPWMRLRRLVRKKVREVFNGYRSERQ